MSRRFRPLKMCLPARSPFTCASNSLGRKVISACELQRVGTGRTIFPAFRDCRGTFPSDDKNHEFGRRDDAVQ